MASGVDPSELRAAREKAGLTQHELARLVGRKAWQGYGESGPKLENMALVRAAYQTQYG